MASVFVFLCVVLTLHYETALVLADGEPCKDCWDEKPKGMALRLNTIAGEKHLVREFIKPDVKPIIKVTKLPLALRFGLGSVAGEVDEFPKPSDEEPVERKPKKSKPSPKCVPSLQPVSLRVSDNSSLTYQPDCILLEQCTGCCNKQAGLSCQPNATTNVTFEVTVLEYAGNKMLHKGKEIVSREKHTKCKCDCIVKEKDCNERQVYNESLCKCVCNNQDAEKKCHNGDNMSWNSHNCSCYCRIEEVCSVKKQFDNNTCRCEWIPESHNTYKSQAAASQWQRQKFRQQIYHYDP